MRSSIVPLFLGAALAVVGCSSSSSSSSGGAPDACTVQCTSPDAGAGTSTVICNNPSKASCVTTTYAGSSAQTEAAQATADCPTNGGTVVTACPTAGLVGCCLIDGVAAIDSCDYAGIEAGEMGSCKQSGGVWTAATGATDAGGDSD